MAFYGTFIMLISAVCLCHDAHRRQYLLPLIIYFVSHLCCYGVSSYYNQAIWKCPLAERKMQQFDHSCIYLLICGSYTLQCAVVIPSEFHWKWSFQLLSVVWLLCIAGIAKTFAFRMWPAYVDTFIYASLGGAVVPYLAHLMEALAMRDLALLAIAGIFYLVGGVIFAVSFPNPSPKVFGSQEIFHLFTVCGQICSFLPAFFVLWSA
mmetsp:Transcript_36291/g.58250  ORF Transcript_36291/g.58250 Transcript_36291/m.58250 type:complete len:207 (+) Transcript_36291:1-621(+)